MIGRSLRCEIRSYLCVSPLSKRISTTPSAARETTLPSPCLSWKKRCAALKVSLRLSALALRSPSRTSSFAHSFDSVDFACDAKYALFDVASEASTETSV